MTLNLVDRLIVPSASLWMANSLKGAWSGRLNHLNFGGHQPYPGMAEAWVVEFCMHVGNSQHNDYKPPIKGCNQGHVTHFKFWCPEWYLWDNWVYNCQILCAGKLYQILACGDKPPLKGAWSESREPVFRSALSSWPNKDGLKCSSVRMYVHPSTKGFFDFSEIWHVHRGQWVMHDYEHWCYVVSCRCRGVPRWPWTLSRAGVEVYLGDYEHRCYLVSCRCRGVLRWPWTPVLPCLVQVSRCT